MIAGPGEETGPGPGAPTPTRLPVGVLISGQGTNLDAILRRCDAGTLDAEVRVVISNRSNAPGLAFSRQRDIPTYVCPRSKYESREQQQDTMRDLLVGRGVQLVVLAGFDQILSPGFVEAFSYRMVNLHPSLLPAFGGGMNAIRDALEHGVKITGCTVHFIASDFPEADSGPIVAQAAVPVLEGDDEETLLTRVHEAEHRLLPHAIQLFAEGRVQVQGRRVQILEASSRVRPDR